MPFHLLVDFSSDTRLDVSLIDWVGSVVFADGRETGLTVYYFVDAIA
jgi:hypothetical protein